MKSIAIGFVLGYLASRVRQYVVLRSRVPW